MTEGFSTAELTKFEKNLLDLASKKMPKETKQFLRKEGTKLRTATAKTARSKVKKDSGGYQKSIKRGKLYKYRGTGDFAIRAYSGAKHAHLIEYGHRQVTSDGREVGFTPGKRVFETAAKGFEGQFYRDTQDFLDNALKKGL